LFGVLVAAILFMSVAVFSEAGKSEKSSSSPSGASIEAFLGRWDLTLQAPDREYPSWLELRQEAGQLKAEMVGRGETRGRFPKLSCQMAASLSFPPKRKKTGPEDMVFEGALVGEHLSGTVTGPNGTSWQWTGQKAPALKRSGAPKWGSQFRCSMEKI